ncbi:MAG: molybdopterin-dependent oxidoreductase [Desulfobacterales bacterium]|nr:molybdopterin-dependent oxidoreductase [Desulfobacterales bacterium]MDX2513122.1 molybdopterin-dependent oxidoreductase [Desulfobacterales bacterium]
MDIKEQQIHHEGTIRIPGFLTFGFKITLFFLILFFILSFQIAQSQEESSPVTTTTPGNASENLPGTVIPTPCTLSPIVVPTLSDTVPGYTELDPETQLHVTGTVQVVDLETYSLEITGKVVQSLKLNYDDLRCMPKIEARPTLVCPGFFQDTATWGGASLKYVIELAGVQEGASNIRLVSADGYSTSVSMEKALSKNNFLAYELEHEPIPILHGFPVRAIFTELSGSTWVKWLVRIEVQ